MSNIFLWFLPPYSPLALFLPNPSPEGRKFRSRTELRQYLDKHNLDHNPEEFDFSIWGRGNRPGGKSSQGPEGKKREDQNNNSKNFAFHFENDLAPYSPTSEGQPSPGMTSSGPAGVGDCPLYPPMGSGPPHLLGQPVGPSYGSIYGPQGALLQPKTILD